MDTKKLLLFVLAVFFTCNLTYANVLQEGNSYDDEIEILTVQLNQMKSQHMANEEEEKMRCEQWSAVISVRVAEYYETHDREIPEFIGSHLLGYLKTWFATVDKNEDYVFTVSGLKATSLEQTRSKIEECEKGLDELKSIKASYDEVNGVGDTSTASQLEEELQQKIMQLKQMLYNLYVEIDYDAIDRRLVACFDRYMTSVIDVYEQDNVRTTSIDGVDWTYTIDKTNMTCEVGADYRFTDGRGVWEEIKTAVDRSVSGEVTIPSEIGGYKVTGILSNAFSGCNDMTSLIIPNSVESIRQNTFYGCKGLTFVQLPDNLKEVPANCFVNCSSLVSVKLPSAITTINPGTFYGCTNLTAIEIPVGVTDIGECAFRESGLVEVDIPQGVESIGYDAFTDCVNLTKVSIPKTVKEIANFNIPGKTHWYTAFANTPSLTSITVEDGNSVFDSRNGCNAIIETATNELIQGCKSTIIPADVETIGHAAFSGQSEISSIIIPANIKAIEGNTFGSRSDSFLRDGAFYKCSGLTAIYSFINNPFEIHESVFGNAYYNSPDDEKYQIYKQATLYVPTGTREQYLSAASWNLFENIVEFDPSSVSGIVVGYQPESIFDLSGRKINQVEKGINIFQEKNGKIRKVIIK